MYKIKYLICTSPYRGPILTSFFANPYPRSNQNDKNDANATNVLAPHTLPIHGAALYRNMVLLNQKDVIQIPMSLSRCVVCCALFNIVE